MWDLNKPNLKTPFIFGFDQPLLSLGSSDATIVSAEKPIREVQFGMWGSILHGQMGTAFANEVRDIVSTVLSLFLSLPLSLLFPGNAPYS